MKKLWYICKFELMRLVSNWRQTLKLFLVPAVVMLAALYLFPVLVNYLSTGSWGQTEVVVVDAPKEFMPYVEDSGFDRLYTFTEAEAKDARTTKQIEEIVASNGILVVFSPNFEQKVRDYYDAMRVYCDNYNPALGESDPDNKLPMARNYIEIYYKEESACYTKAQQFQSDVIDKFADSYIDLLDIDTGNIPQSICKINDFNPIGQIVYKRFYANSKSARIVPQITILVLYYCIYSLSMDVFAGDRERGFLRKTLMSPVSARTVIWGKTLTLEIVAMVSAILMIFVMFLASWLNFSNDALSLLPFGMLLLPDQLLKIFLICLSTSLLMIALSVGIVFKLNKPDDIQVNLQFPLVLLLADLFIFMLRPETVCVIEYLLPLHGSMTAIQSVMLANDSIPIVAAVVISNVIYALLILEKTLKKEELL